jgi:hypothetical protein
MHLSKIPIRQEGTRWQPAGAEPPLARPKVLPPRPPRIKYPLRRVLLAFYSFRDCEVCDMSDWRSTAAGAPRRSVTSLARAMVPAERSGTMSPGLNGAPLTSFSPVNWFLGHPLRVEEQPWNWELGVVADRSALLSCFMSRRFPASLSCFATKKELCLPPARAQWTTAVMFRSHGLGSEA